MNLLLKKESKKDLDNKRTPKISRYLGFYKDTYKKPKIVTIKKIKANQFFNVSMQLHLISDFLTPKESVFFTNSCGKSYDVLKQANLARVLRVLVVRGNQETAEAMVSRYPVLVLLAGEVTDYSGRRFNCTAYEYAYWAKDTHMCRMFEQHMDQNTKAAMREKVIAIDTVGLTYKQHGKEIEHSKHFDMTPFIRALQYYVDGYYAWFTADNYNEMKEAWMLVGLEQLDLPMNTIECCRLNRSFNQRIAFNKNKLSMVLTYLKIGTNIISTSVRRVVARGRWAVYRGG